MDGLRRTRSNVVSAGAPPRYRNADPPNHPGSATRRSSYPSRSKSPTLVMNAPNPPPGPMIVRIRLGSAGGSGTSRGLPQTQKPEVERRSESRCLIALGGEPFAKLRDYAGPGREVKRRVTRTLHPVFDVGTRNLPHPQFPQLP